MFIYTFSIDALMFLTLSYIFHAHNAKKGVSNGCLGARSSN
jgi:hypothetical protein